MGLTHLKVRLGNPADRRRSLEAEMLVDSGAIYSVVPTAVLRRLGIPPRRRETFTLADGSHVRRSVGLAIFELEGREGGSQVIFGAQGDACLLGAVTLEELGLMLDPLKRQLRPLKLMLA